MTNNRAGYDTGVISAVLISLKSDLGHVLSSSEQELITSITSGGALVGAVIAGLFADRFGRKLPLYLGCFVFSVGAIIQAAAYSLTQMTIGRFIVGLGVGSAAMVIPLYIGELAPAKYRGRMIAFDNMSVTLGQLISYALGAGFAEISQGWRYMVGLGVVPALILAALLPMCPESPRQLLLHGKYDQARVVLRRTYPNANEMQITSKLDLIHDCITEMKTATGEKTMWWTFTQLFTDAPSRRALICACTVMAISQLGGFNTLMYYSDTLFSLVGFKKPAAVSIVVGATNFIFTFVNMLIIDRVGRRRILLCTVSGMVSLTPSKISRLTRSPNNLRRRSVLLSPPWHFTISQSTTISFWRLQASIGLESSFLLPLSST
jgi:SP family myo-inositol transporter-like MFS transporter 13